MSINVATSTFFLSLYASRMISFLLPVSMQDFSRASPLIYPLLLSHPESSSLGARELIYAPSCNDWSVDLHPFSAVWSSWFLGKEHFKRCLVDSWASTLQAYFSRKSRCSYSLVSRDFLAHCLVSIVQGVASFKEISNFFPAWLMVSWHSSSSRSMKDIRLGFRALSSFCFSIAHSCFPGFWAAFDMPRQISGHKSSGLVVAWICVRRSPDHMCPGGGFFFNNLTFVSPVHEPDKVRRSKHRWYAFSCITSRCVCVFLGKSKNFRGIGNDSSFGT